MNRSERIRHGELFEEMNRLEAINRDCLELARAVLAIVPAENKLLHRLARKVNKRRRNEN